MSWFSYKKSKQVTDARVGSITYSGEKVSAQDFLTAAPVCLAQLQLAEINEYGGRNVLFAALEHAYQKAPTRDAMGLLATNFVLESGAYEVNISRSQRTQVMQAVESYYRRSRVGVSAQQFRAHITPVHIFAPVREQVYQEVLETLDRGRYPASSSFQRWLVAEDGRAEVYKVRKQDEKRDVAQKLSDIRGIAMAARRMGLPVPAFYATLQF